MINLETALSLASLGLIVMFVLLMYSFLSFLIGPKALGQVVQPEGGYNTNSVDIRGTGNSTNRNYLLSSKKLWIKVNWHHHLCIRHCSINWYYSHPEYDCENT